MDYKSVIDQYEAARKLHDVPEWTGPIDNKIKLAKKRAEDTFYDFKKQVDNAKQAGEDPKIEEKKAIIAKWEMPELVEKFEKFLALMDAADPNPSKDPADSSRTASPALKIKPLSPEMKAFMPAWQTAIGVAFSRDYANAANEMSGAAARAEAAEAKKAGTEDVEVLKAIGERYPEILKTAGETPKLQTMTVEYQDKPGEWKKVTGKALKVELTRMEFKPDPVDKKEQPAIFIEFTDLNAGSLAVLYKARKKTLAKKDLDLLTKFALIEGATESAQSLGGTAPDRYWLYAGEARATAPKPNSREFEARTLFHQSEFEWRKSITKYNAIEKSKVLLSDYNGTTIVKKYQPQIAKRAETGKEYTFLPADLVANGDYNTYKLRKEDPAWVASKGIDFKDSLYNFVEAEFIALPGLTYRCWVYAGGCCQEVWNGSYQITEGTTKNKGKDVPINPGDMMAAPLPMPSGLKKTHDDHKPKGVKDPKDHPKTAAKWDWDLHPGAQDVRSPRREGRPHPHRSAGIRGEVHHHLVVAPEAARRGGREGPGQGGLVRASREGRRQGNGAGEGMARHRPVRRGPRQRAGAREGDRARQGVPGQDRKGEVEARQRRGQRAAGRRVRLGQEQHLQPEGERQRLRADPREGPGRHGRPAAHLP
jgi:hypothetical protein